MVELILKKFLLKIEQHQVAGCTLGDVQSLIETLSMNGEEIQLKTVKSGNVISRSSSSFG